VAIPQPKPGSRNRSAPDRRARDDLSFWLLIMFVWSWS